MTPNQSENEHLTLLFKYDHPKDDMGRLRWDMVYLDPKNNQLYLEVDYSHGAKGFGPENMTANNYKPYSSLIKSGLRKHLGRMITDDDLLTLRAGNFCIDSLPKE